MEFSYDDPISNDAFENLKQNAIAVRQTYDDTYGYASEKVKHITNLANIGDNFWYIYWMFDWINQSKVQELCSPETQEILRKEKLYRDTQY